MGTIFLKIADTIIRCDSRFRMESRNEFGFKRLKNFLYKKSARPDIYITIEVTSKLPKIGDSEDIFITRHFQDGSENWRWQKSNAGYVYQCPLSDRRQLAAISYKFDKIKIYVMPKKDGKIIWDISDIVYDLLQVILINYFAARDGVFIHGIGIKDLDKSGILFAGKSGAGKSTMARIWHKHSNAMILNDDRIITRKIKNKFYIYGTPWHGDFSDYLSSNIERAVLNRVFFIRHSRENVINGLSTKAAFNMLYPAIFPTFWDKKGINNIFSLCSELIDAIPCNMLGFRKDKSIIKFVRRIIK